MTGTEFRYGRATEWDDALRYGVISADSFLMPPELEKTFLKLLGWEGVRTIKRQGELLGGLVLLPLGQWFGGRSVSMAGIGSVAIVPHGRGNGAAAFLMKSVLAEAYERGFALSTLYPATQRLYRQVGYEQAGTHGLWEVALSSIGRSGDLLPVQPMDATGDRPRLAALYRRQAPGENGWIDRSEALWQFALTTELTQPVTVYQLGTDEGYVALKTARQADRAIVTIRDWVALSPAAERTTWQLLAGYRSQVEAVRWYGPTIDPRCLRLPEQTARLVSCQNWMIRVVNLAEAIAQRGYPAALEAELHLRVSDPLLPENGGNWIVSVSGGRGAIERGGRGDLAIGIDGLGPLYTGYLSAEQLQRSGKLDGSPESIAIASQLFGGSAPWMADFF
ncbi:MAG TPA: GNAT family N-acetyltransferase [Coleofasciculaceae cyanobacterium]